MLMAFHYLFIILLAISSVNTKETFDTKCTLTGIHPVNVSYIVIALAIPEFEEVL